MYNQPNNVRQLGSQSFCKLTRKLTIIGSDNGLSSRRLLAIISANVALGNLIPEGRNIN